jgi:hypothetical protein
MHTRILETIDVGHIRRRMIAEDGLRQVNDDPPEWNNQSIGKDALPGEKSFGLLPRYGPRRLNL